MAELSVVGTPKFGNIGPAAEPAVGNTGVLATDGATGVAGVNVGVGAGALKASADGNGGAPEGRSISS